MSLPDGVTTCLLTYGPITDTFGNLADSITVEVVADRTIVHAASGRTLFKNPVVVSADGGGVAQLPVPHTDQTGFRDQQQNTLTGWYYTVRLSARFGSSIQTDTKTFQPLVGQTTVDADLLPSNGMVTPGVTAPTAVVTSVNGETGAVTVSGGEPYEMSRRDVSAIFNTSKPRSVLVSREGPAVTISFDPDVAYSYTDYTEPGSFNELSGSLPTGLRPPALTGGPVFSDDGSPVGFVTIDPGGFLNAYALNGARLAGIITGSFTYRTDQAPPSPLPGVPDPS